MKWLNDLNALKKILYILIQILSINLLVKNVFAKRSPSIIRHPGTCTFQHSQSACNFSLLCYLAGGLPVEGCGTESIAVTCCVLQQFKTNQQVLGYLSKESSNSLKNKINFASENKNYFRNKNLNFNFEDLNPQNSFTTRNSLPSSNFGEKSFSTESSLLPKEAFTTLKSSIYSQSNLNDNSNNLHSSSSSLSTSTNPYDSLNNEYQADQIYSSPRLHHYSFSNSNPASLQYFHHHSQAYNNLNPSLYHLNDHYKHHQQNVYLYQQQQEYYQQNHQNLIKNLNFPTSNARHHSLIQQYYHSPHHSQESSAYLPNTNINSRSFQVPRYNANNPTTQYRPNYLVNNNLNYYSDSLSGYSETSSLSFPNQMNNFNSNEQNDNSNSYQVNYNDATPSTISTTDSSSLIKPNNDKLKFNKIENSNSPYVNDYMKPSETPSSVSISSNSISPTYNPSQTINFQTYQKHDNLNSYNSVINPKANYFSTYSTPSSFDTTTNSSNSFENNGSYNKKTEYLTPLLNPTAMKLLNPSLFKKPSANTDYETYNPTLNTNYKANIQNEDSLANSLNIEEETPHNNNNNNRLNEEEEYDNNALRRSRLSSPSLNSITIDQSNYQNYIGEEMCGKPISKPTSRIIGGQDAYFGEFPWQVHIKIAKHQCGGALINRDFVITAAHCVYQAPLEQLAIIIGAHDIEEHRYQAEPPQYLEVESVLLHPHFRFSAAHPDRFDIALLKLKKPASYTGAVRPVCLPPRQLKLEGWRAVVTGWGKTDTALTNRYGTRLLQKVDVPIIKNNECEKWHQTRGIDLKIFSEMMCAGYEDGQKDACVGDSGGPLVIFLNGRWTLAGITSAGFGCAQSKQPGIYHRVSHTVDWILENIIDSNKK